MGVEFLIRIKIRIKAGDEKFTVGDTCIYVRVCSLKGSC